MPPILRRPFLPLLAALVLLAATAAGGAVADDAAASSEPGGADELEANGLNDADDHAILEPLFPGIRGRTGVRMQLRTEIAPGADVDSGHVNLYRPELRLRGTAPISERAAVRITARYGTGIYEFSGDTAFSTLGDPLDLHRALLTVEGALRIDDPERSLLAEGEVWSLLGGLFGGSSWEDDDFDRGLSGGGVVAIGYELPEHIRLAAGVRLRSALDDGGLDIDPAISLRWNLCDDFTLRSRGLGLQLEYRASPKLELFASAFRRTRSHRLEDRLGADDLVFRDREVRTGLGFEWRFSKYVRLNLEAGAVVWRNLRVTADDTSAAFDALDLDSSVGPSAYVDLRLELRP